MSDTERIARTAKLAVLEQLDEREREYAALASEPQFNLGEQADEGEIAVWREMASLYRRAAAHIRAADGAA